MVLVASLFAVSLTIIPGANAVADGSIACGTSGTFEVVSNVVTGNSSCTGTAVVPSGVTGIASGALNNAAITSISIPSSVTTIGNGIFNALTTVAQGCGTSGTFTITYSAPNPTVSNSLNCSGALQIPEGITRVTTAFYSKGAAITSLSLPTTLTAIGDNAFRTSGNFTSINIPASVISIGTRAFSLGGANTLTSITFASNSQLTTIKDFAFEYAGITSISIPASVSSIGGLAFVSAPRLSSIYFLGSTAPGTGGETINFNPTAPTAYITATATGFSAAWRGLNVVSPPSAPTSLAGTAGDGAASIAFTAGATNGAAITNYQYSLDGTTYTAFSPSVTVSPVSISGLTNGTTYNIYLKAVNAAGAGVASSSETITPIATIKVTNSDAADRAAGASRYAQEQRELLELLSIIPPIASMSKKIGDMAQAATQQKCVKGKNTKYIKKGAKCPRGFVKK